MADDSCAVSRVSALPRFLVLVACAFLALPWLPASGAARVVSFKSGGKSIRTEWFDSVVRGDDAPVVIVLHGSGGLEDTGGFFRSVAQDLSSKGMTAVVVHYMDRSGLEAASSAQMGSHLGEWLGTVRDAVDFVAKQPGVDAARVSLLGHSLGAQLALHEAAKDARIYAVVDMAGCFVLPSAGVKRMPPVLILHGTADRVVPLTRERALVAVLKRCGGKYQEHLFKAADHGFGNVPFDKLMGLMVAFLQSPKS